MLRQGLGAGAVLPLLTGGTAGPEHRQIGVIDRYGHTALHTGGNALSQAADARGEDCLALGNLLASPHCPQRMVDSFAAAMTQAGKPAEIHWYAANHAFANPTGQNYDGDDAQAAWQRTLAFFRQNLA